MTPILYNLGHETVSGWPFQRASQYNSISSVFSPYCANTFFITKEKGNWALTPAPLHGKLSQPQLNLNSIVGFDTKMTLDHHKLNVINISAPLGPMLTKF